MLSFFASAVKSDLRLPDNTSKFLSIYLLLALGLKGGNQVSNASALAASASYIAASAAIRYTIPEANSAFYIALAKLI